MRDIVTIFVHCSAYPNGHSKFTIRDIDRDHAVRGFQREEEAIARFNSAYPYIGYHAVIDVYGRIHSGRGENEVGAHAVGHNAHSLGVCLMGTDQFTVEQWISLKAVVQDWQRRFGDMRVRGHREVNSHKECPGFDTGHWIAGGMEPLPGHVWRPSHAPPAV